MKHNRRAIKSRPEIKAVQSVSKKKETNWKKVFFGLVAADVLSSLFLAGYMISKKKERPVEKVTKDLNKKYKKTKKKFTKKANRLLRELESSAGDLMNNASTQMESTTDKAKNITSATIDRTKDSLNDLQATLENILKKIKK